MNDPPAVVCGAAAAPVRVIEACPRCATLIELELSPPQAERGFTCPRCNGGLLLARGDAERFGALAYFGFSSLLTLSVLIIFAVLGLSLVVAWGGAFSHRAASSAWALLAALLAALTLIYLWLLALVCRWVGRSHRALFNVFRGRKLMAAQRRGSRWRLMLIPDPIEHERRDGGDRGQLAGALTPSEEDARRGGVSLKDEKAE